MSPMTPKGFGTQVFPVNDRECELIRQKTKRE